MRGQLFLFKQGFKTAAGFVPKQAEIILDYDSETQSGVILGYDPREIHKENKPLAGSQLGEVSREMAVEHLGADAVLNQIIIQFDFELEKTLAKVAYTANGEKGTKEIVNPV